MKKEWNLQYWEETTKIPKISLKFILFKKKFDGATKSGNGVENIEGQESFLVLSGTFFNLRLRDRFLYNSIWF